MKNGFEISPDFSRENLQRLSALLVLGVKVSSINLEDILRKQIDVVL